MLPFSYTLRNLLREPGRSIQKVAGAALLLFLLMAAASFNAGMDRLLRASGSPDNVILLGAGSEESVERSQIPVQTESIATAGIRGITSRAGQPAVSGEVHYMGMIGFPDGQEAQGLTRGVTAAALEVHREVRLLEGNWPRSGEVIVGSLAHQVLGVAKRALAVGESIILEEATLEISGIFDAEGTVMESEIWFVRNDLMTLVQRETLSCVVVKMSEPADTRFADLFAKQRLDLELTAIPEDEYYANLSRFYAPIRGMTWLTVAMISIGAVMGGLNILYATFSSRIREIATLQTLGYSRRAIFFSLLQESLLNQVIGLALAVFAGLLFLQGLRIPFSMGIFEMELSPGILLFTFLAALSLGSLGMLPPSIRCLRQPVPTAIKASL